MQAGFFGCSATRNERCALRDNLIIWGMNREDSPGGGRREATAPNASEEFEAATREDRNLSAAAPVVVAMLKAPRAGFVKTRLAREVGAEEAAEIYRRLVEDQLAAVPRSWRVEVHMAPAEAAAEMRQWLGPRHAYYPQTEGDLGERLIHAVRGAFERAAAAVIVVGGDCPGLNDACLREAWAALASADVVLGPAFDGGYYLAGLRRPCPEIFRRIPWSSPVVLQATLDRVRGAALSHALLAVKEDVDDLASWRRAQASGRPVATAGTSQS